MKINNITWEEIEKYLEKDIYKKFLKQISPSVFEMARDEKNRSKVVKTVLKVLQERDPQNATEDYAQKVVDVMQKVANNLLKKRQNKK